jgi:hypothetical protein
MSEDDFLIKYWGQDYSYQSLQEEKRSTRRKLMIVFSFVSLLAIIPVLVFGLSEISADKGERITTVAKPETKVEEQRKLPTPTPVVQNIGYEMVINNDSYWKISKRHCGTGIYYLSIKEQNGGKALFQGDTVVVTCR